MNFDLTETQKTMQMKVRDFAEGDLKPIASKMEKDANFDLRILKKLGELDLLGITISPEYGGGGLDTICLAIAVEEISKVCASTGVIVAVHNSLVGNIILNFASENIKNKYLPILSRGEKIGAFALTEPNAGSDISSLESTAFLNGKNYILNGSKIFITSAGLADIFIVFAYTSKEKKKDGISVFVVEKDMPGFSIEEKASSSGLRATYNCSLNFDNCIVPEDNLIGEEGQGFKIIMPSLDSSRICIAAQALGIAQASFHESLEYLKNKSQSDSGKLQLAHSQLAEMATCIEASRYLVYKAAFLKDKNHPFSKEASMAKLFSSDTAMKVSAMAVQICKERGCARDYAVETYYRGAKATQIYEGTNEIQKLIIAKKILE